MSSAPPTHRRSFLDALCRRIVPAAYEADSQLDIVAHVERRVAALDPPLRRDVVGALRFFDHPVTGMLLSGRPRRFSTLPPAEQDALLLEWERSPLALRRTVFQALRRLILSTYYARPESHAALGYLPPLYMREPAFAWEGPLHDRGDSDGPVAVERRSSVSPRPPGPPTAREATHDDVTPESDVAQSTPVHAPAIHADASAALQGIVPGSALNRESFVADVCVIGSGAGGAVAAARLAEDGFDVLLLEEGGYYRGADFDDDESRLAPLLYADGAARATDDLSITLLQGRSVGGGTTVNWLMTLRPMPWVLDEWERQHGAELLAERSLTPAMAAIENQIHARTVPDDAHSPSNRLIVDGCTRLGWRLLDAKINARDCVRAGSCGLGCRWSAKQSAGEVFLPRALRAGARVLCDVSADRMELRERAGRAPLKRVHATVLDRATREPRGRITIDAPIVVIAGGAVGTPALLERSGLGGGGVGRWLRLHPTTAVFGIYDHTMYGSAGIPQSAACGEFLDGVDGYGFWIECPPLRPGLAAAALQGFGREHREHMLSFRNLGPLIVLVRDGAELARSSGDVRVDRTGRVRIRYRLTATDRRQLIAGVQTTARLHLAMDALHALTLHVGASPVRSEADVHRLARLPYGPNRISLFSAHVNGTCRMGLDASGAGCTPDGERFGVPGLYVADGSLFPTAPGVNPQLAIMALAHLVAGRIADRHSPV